MRAPAALAAVVLVVAACSGGGAGTDTTSAGEGTDTTGTTLPEIRPEAGTITAGVMLVDGVVRQYLVAVPPDYTDGAGVPVVFDLHGRGGTAPGQALTSKITDIAWARGFVVVHPHALGDIPTWSVWADHENLENDVAFFRMMIDVLDEALSIDRDRVFVTGFSNGGGMAARLACEMGDAIAGIAPVGGSHEGWEECEPGGPIPVLAFHGTADEIVPFEGGNLLPTLPLWAGWWAENDGCEAEPESITVPGSRFWRWDDCDGGATVTLVALEGLGHEWPARVQQVTRNGESVWVGASHLIVEFFAGL